MAENVNSQPQSREVLWSGRTVLLARCYEPRSVFSRTRPGKRLSYLLPVLRLLCHGLGWQLFEVTVVYGRGASGGFGLVDLIYLWFRSLGPMVLIDDGVAARASGHKGGKWCDVRAVVPPPDELFHRPVALCVPRTDAAAYVRRWAEALERPVHHRRHAWHTCVAWVLRELADITVVYAGCAYLHLACSSTWVGGTQQALLVLGACPPKVLWSTLAATLGDMCRLWGFEFIDESRQPVSLVFGGTSASAPDPPYLSQPVLDIAAVRVEGGGLERGQENGNATSADPCVPRRGLGRQSRGVTGHLRHWRVFRRREATRSVGRFRAYRFAARELRSTERRALISSCSTSSNYGLVTAVAAAVTALGYLVCGLRDDVGGYNLARSGLLLLALRSCDASPSLLQAYKCRKGHCGKIRETWVFSVRELRWASAALHRLLRSKRRVKKSAPKFASYLAGAGVPGAGFIVHPKNAAYLVHPERLAVLQHAVAQPGGAARILSTVALGVIAGGMILVSEAVADHFEQVLESATLVQGARVEWFELSDPDEFVRRLASDQ